MKTSLFFTLCIALSISLISCTGEDGTDGVGIVSTVDNGDGTFTITFSDGTTFTSGNLTGDSGADGNANVQSFDLNLPQTQDELYGGVAHLPNIPELSKGNIANKAIFFYLIVSNIDGDHQITTSLPGVGCTIWLQI